MEVLLNHCAEFGCYQPANYNYLFLLNKLENPKGIYCHQHKKNKMISLKDFKAGYNVQTLNIDQNDNIDQILKVTKEDIIVDHLDKKNKNVLNLSKYNNEKNYNEKNYNEKYNNEKYNNEKNNNEKIEENQPNKNKKIYEVINVTKHTKKVPQEEKENYEINNQLMADYEIIENIKTFDITTYVLM
jgi:hypothetical protein